ncbi:MAG: hypothetical protein M1813_003525 [Trichoglossum hirsutum]|nr:MAG: hypothetical protein M1813_003525 [Trichoglossum hirsutum]
MTSLAFGVCSEIEMLAIATVTDFGNDDGDDDDDLPTIEDLLYTTLKKKGFVIEGSSLDYEVQGVEERASSIDCSRSASGDSLDSSRDTFDKRERQQQKAEAEEEVDKDDDEDDGQLQQRVNSVAVLTTERVSDTHLSSKGDESARPAKRQRSLPYSDSSLEPSHDEAESYSDSYSDDELNNAKAKLDKVDERPRPAKWKRPSSSYNGPTQWKCKNYLQYRSFCQRKLCSKSYQHYSKLHSLLDQGSRVAAGSSAEGQLPSPAPSALQATDTDVSPNCCNSLPRDVLPTLTESIGHVRKIDDFTIKPIEHHLFLLTGFSQYTSSQPSFGEATLSTAKAGCNHVDATCTRLQNGRAVDARALALRRSELPSSDDDGGLSDSDLESSSSDDGCLNEAEQGHSSMSKHSR